MEPAVTIIGSYNKNLRMLLEARRSFMAHGARVLRPDTDEVISSSGGHFVRMKGDPEKHSLVQQMQFDAIRRSDLVFVVNLAGYIGSSGMAECGFAHGLGIPICFLEQPYEPAALAMMDLVGTPTQALTLVQDKGKLVPSDRQLIDSFIHHPSRLLLASEMFGKDLVVRKRHNQLVLLHATEQDNYEHRIAAQEPGASVTMLAEPSCEVCQYAAIQVAALCEREHIAVKRMGEE